MIDRRALLVFFLTALIGCTAVPTRETVPVGSVFATDAGDSAFPESQYLTAKGIGQSEPEASRQALAALAAIFESDIQAEVSARAESVIHDTTEAYKKQVTEAIRVRSAVTFQGARIGRTWQEGGHHFALAVLEKSKARAAWRQQADRVDDRIAGELAVYHDPATSSLRRIMTANTILSLWIDRQLLESRLRIIDVDCASPDIEHIVAIVRQLPALRSRTRIRIAITGPGAEAIRDRIAERLTSERFVLCSDRDRPDAVIEGVSRVEPLDLGRDDWVFVRASVSLAVIEALSGTRVAEGVEKTRAAHLTLREARRKAVDEVAGQAAEQIVRDLTVTGN